MGGAASAFAVLCVLALIGAPVALNIPGTQPEWTGVAFESVIVGLVVELFVAIVLLHAGIYALPTAFVLTVVIVGCATAVLRHLGPPPDRSRLRGLEPALIGLGALTFVLVALHIRHAPSYFIFQTGDMGGYVNSANILTKGGKPFGTETQGFTLFLRETNLLLGKANTVAGLPALGAALLLGAIAFARTLRLHLVAAIAVGFVLLVHPVAVWFSLFPVSEALFATLLLALLYLVVRMRSTRSTPYAAIAGLVAGSLLLVRGEAMLLAPILTVVLLASVALDDEVTARAQRRFTLVALVTLIVSYAYDVHYTHIYFRAQLRHLLPHFASHFAEHAHLEDVTVPLAIAAVVAVAVVVGLDRLVVRYLRPLVVDRPLLFWRCAYGAAIGISAIALLFFRLHGLTDTWARWGPVLLVLTALGAVGVALRPGRYVDAASGFLLFAVVGVFVVLFARRVPEPKVQTYYLYFDRYLFSEVLPAALPLAAISIQIVIDACARVTPARVVKVAVVAILAIVLAGLTPQIHETERVTKYRLLGHSYDAVHRLDELTRDASGKPGVVVYSGSKARPVAWFYPNTYRAFALPLRQSFDRTVLGIPTAPLAKDQVFTPDAALAALHDDHADSGYLVQLRAPGTQHAPDTAHSHWLASVAYTSPLLGQRTHKPAAPWTFSHLRFDVYALS